MKNLLLYIVLIMLCGCSSNKHMYYLNNINDNSKSIVNSKYYLSIIEINDILKIDVNSTVAEAAIPYNRKSNSEQVTTNIDLLKLEGYHVDKFYNITFPILGKINVQGITIDSLENKLTYLLSSGNHLINPSVNIKRINSKFTVLGEVNSPGTFSYYDENINILQALGYAGDLTVDGKRSNIILIRQSNGVRTVNKFSLNATSILNSPFYFIKTNDIIVVNPNFSKVKSAGFIGSPSSIASISSILLSITLLILNN